MRHLPEHSIVGELIEATSAGTPWGRLRPVVETHLSRPFAGTRIRPAAPKMAHQREYWPGQEGFSDTGKPYSDLT